MTTDLRAALRDNRDTLAWLLTDQHEQQHDEIDADDNHREKRQRAVDALTRLVALADAPPTVAELLPLVDATHEARWTAIGGEAMRCIGVPTRAGVERRVEFQRAATGRWQGCSLGVTDVDRPATLVEVA